MKKVHDNNSEILENLRKFITSKEFSFLNDDLKDSFLSLFEAYLVKEKNDDVGLMEKLFGCHYEIIPLYIAFVVVMLVITIGGIYVFLPPQYKQTPSLEFWRIIDPVITGILGYVFGTNSKK